MYKTQGADKNTLKSKHIKDFDQKALTLDKSGRQKHKIPNPTIMYYVQ